MSNLPPGVSGASWPTEIEHRCARDHVWLSPAYSELGAVWEADEERGPICPVCQDWAVGDYETMIEDGKSPRELGLRPLEGYVMRDQGAQYDDRDNLIADEHFVCYIPEPCWICGVGDCIIDHEAEDERYNK